MDLKGLNEIQQKAVLLTDGPIMILAGAGSGKTRTLVKKISYLIDEKKISPFKILALTFSNKAAKEMRDRVSHEVRHDIGALQITTFHAFCAKVLRSEAKYIGLSQNFTIYDTSESKSIAKTILSRRGISTKEVSPFELLYFFEELKNNGYYAEQNAEPDFTLDKNDPLYAYYLEYEQELHKANALDFGGLITAVIQLFETHAEVLERYQKRFQYVLVDEYQDTNRAQFKLVKMLTEQHQNICVVGDEDQSIYSWRGADIRNILDFEETYPKVQLLKLEQNYRSTKNIIEAATHVISKNQMRKGKSMWTQNPEGENIEIVECSNEKEEANFIALNIKEKSKEGTHLGEIAVFYRTNAQSRIIEDALRKLNIPYRIIGGIKFYERKEIRDLLAYMRIVVNPKDSLALSRIINVPTRGIGATSLRKLENEAVNLNHSLLEMINHVLSHQDEFAHVKLSAKVRSALNQLMSLLGEAKLLEESGEVLPSVIYEKLLHESSYYEFLKASKDYESQARMENLEELHGAIKQFEASTPKPSLSGFLETITLDSNQEQSVLEEQTEFKGEVSLMTIHGAKGLEFPYVYLSGVEENIFPSFKSIDSGEEGIEEERRLFYVAMTRAMTRLYITFAQARLLFGQLKFNGPSRYLDEIPNKYYQWINRAKNNETNAYDWGKGNQDDDISQESPYDADGPVIYQEKWNRHTYPKGSLVVHTLYGEGKVLDSEGLGNDERVMIQFKDGAKKKFMVKFAPLVGV
jgi:DNA helicase II / ATP-dependent DNA helicase PcrA